MPGGPYLVFPVVANLFRSGAAPGPLIALLTAKTLVSPVRMLTYEAPLLGWPLTLARLHSRRAAAAGAGLARPVALHALRPTLRADQPP